MRMNLVEVIGWRIYSMDGEVNQGDYRKIETKLETALKEGADVRAETEPVYEGNSTRPKEFKVTYTIDGEKRNRDN